MMLSMLAVAALVAPPSSPELSPAADAAGGPWPGLGTEVWAYTPARWAPELGLGVELDGLSWLAGGEPGLDGVVALPGQPVPPGLWVNVSEFDALVWVGAAGEYWAIEPGEALHVIEIGADGGMVGGVDDDPRPGWVKCRDGWYACCTDGPPKRARCVKEATRPEPHCDYGGPGASECATATE